MSSEWAELSLGMCLEKVIDNRGKTPPFSESVSPYALIEVNAIVGKSKEPNLALVRKYVSEETYFSWFRAGHPAPGDIIFSTVGSIAEVALYTGGSACIAQNLVGLRPKSGVITSDFLYYTLVNPKLQLQLRSLDISSVQPSIKVPHLLATEISVPSIRQQVSIAAILAVLDDRITLLRETNATLEAIAQALFKSWFVDFDPVRAKMEGRVSEGMDEATAALFPDSFEETELGEVPRGWRYCSLKDVVKIFDSKRVPLSGAERDKRKGLYPYYGAAALMDYVDDYLFDGVYLLTGEDGSVANEAGFPITQYVWGRFWVNNHAHILQGNESICTEHLMLALMKTNIKPYITGAVQAKLSQSNMWRIQFLRADNLINYAFSEILQPLFCIIRNNNDAIKSISFIRDSLLPRLISGKLQLS